MNRERWTPVLAAVATTLTVWSMSPVVDGSGWWAPSLLMIAVVMLAGMGLRELRVPAALVVPGQAVAGVVAVTAVYVGSDAVLGLLPGPQAVRTLTTIVLDGGDTIQRYQAPVPLSTGLSLLVAAGVLGVALCVDLLAVTLRAPAAAGLPLLALYCAPPRGSPPTPVRSRPPAGAWASPPSRWPCSCRRRPRDCPRAC